MRKKQTLEVAVRNAGQHSSSSARASVFAVRWFVALAAIAASSLPARAQLPSDMKDCEQQDWARPALRACSAILQSGALTRDVEARVRLARGRAWLREEEPEEAVTDFTRAIEIEPANFEALRGRIRAYTVLEKPALAAKDWSAIIALKPEAEENYVARAAALLAAGDTSAALADFDKAVTLNPKSIPGHIGRGKVFVALDRRELALKAFDTAQAIDPNNFAPYLARGEAADKWGDEKAAIANYSNALRRNTVLWDASKNRSSSGTLSSQSQTSVPIWD